MFAHGNNCAIHSGKLYDQNIYKSFNDWMTYFYTTFVCLKITFSIKSTYSYATLKEDTVNKQLTV